MYIISNLLKAVLYECCAPNHVKEIIISSVFDITEKYAKNDLIAFSKKDPSASNDLTILAQTSTSYSAVLHYRLAHFLFYSNLKLSNKEKESYAYLISQRGKLKSGAEIHFKAKIGERFVLDHGYGTVFGDTTVIGDDCYILGGVILGAKGISGNPSSSRHPIIGNNVQIGSFSEIFGRVYIGENVFIGANCTITKDIPPNTKLINKKLIFKKDPS